MVAENDTMLTKIVRTGFGYGPIFFGLLFIPPVAAQAIEAVGIVPPLGMTPLATGFLFGGLWGLFAQISGSWLTWRA